MRDGRHDSFRLNMIKIKETRMNELLHEENQGLEAWTCEFGGFRRHEDRVRVTLADVQCARGAGNRLPLERLLDRFADAQVGAA